MISSNISEPSIGSSLMSDMEPSSTPAIDALLPTKEPLVDESEPIKYLGSHSITIVDSTRLTLKSQLETDMADLSLVVDESPVGLKPFTTKEQELMRDLPRRECMCSTGTSLGNRHCVC